MNTNVRKNDVRKDYRGYYQENENIRRVNYPHAASSTMIEPNPRYPMNMSRQGDVRNNYLTSNENERIRIVNDPRSRSFSGTP